MSASEPAEGAATAQPAPVVLVVAALAANAGCAAAAGGLPATTRQVVAAAARCGGEVHVLVAGAGCAAAAQAAAGIAGVAKVLVADAAHHVSGGAENLAALVSTLAGGCSHILAAAGAPGRDVLPRVAAMCDVAMLSGVIAIETPDTFVRPIYAGNLLATVRSTDTPKIITVRTTAFDAAGQGGQAPIETIAVGADLGLSRRLDLTLATSSRPDLGAAKVVVAGGRGLASAENFRRLLEPLADRLGAAIGATRAAVDAGFVGNDLQIGQTGRVVAPDLYFAIGISGAIQHVIGMRDARVIVAIDRDAEAPIFAVADYALVGDLFSLVPALIAELDG